MWYVSRLIIIYSYQKSQAKNACTCPIIIENINHIRNLIITKTYRKNSSGFFELRPTTPQGRNGIGRRICVIY